MNEIKKTIYFFQLILLKNKINKGIKKKILPVVYERNENPAKIPDAKRYEFFLLLINLIIK